MFLLHLLRFAAVKVVVSYPQSATDVTPIINPKTIKPYERRTTNCV